MLPMTSSFDLTPGCTPMNKTWEYHTGTLSYGDPLGGGVGSMTYPSLVCSCLLPSWGLWPGSIYPTSVSWDLVSYHPLSTVPPPPSIHGVPRYSLFYSELSWFYQYYLCFDFFFPLLSFMCACTQLNIWLWAVTPIKTSGKWIKQTWCYTSEIPSILRTKFSWQYDKSLGV